MKPDDSVRDAIALYQQYRINEQRKFYEQRADEYDNANGQLSSVTTFLLTIAAVAGALGAAGAEISRASWGVVAAVCSALVAAIAGWGTLISFQQNAKLFHGTGVALRKLGGQLADHPSDRAALHSTVVQVEGVLQSEAGQWAQQLAGSAAQLATQLQLPTQPGTAAGGEQART
jgi:hypothetical protein